MHASSHEVKIGHKIMSLPVSDYDPSSCRNPLESSGNPLESNGSHKRYCSQWHTTVECLFLLHICEQKVKLVEG